MYLIVYGGSFVIFVKDISKMDGHIDNFKILKIKRDSLEKS